MAVTDGRTIDPSTGLIPVAGEDGDGNEAAAEANVEDYGDQSEDGDATEEAGQGNGESGIDNSGTLIVGLPGQHQSFVKALRSIQRKVEPHERHCYWVAFPRHGIDGKSHRFHSGESIRSRDVQTCPRQPSPSLECSSRVCSSRRGSTKRSQG